MAQDMRRDGFDEARTIASALKRIGAGRDTWDARTVVIVDEGAMLDSKLLAELTAHAGQAGAKLILVATTASCQHRAGRHVRAAEGPLRRRRAPRGAPAAKIDKARRRDDGRGDFSGARALRREGAIHWTEPRRGARRAVAQWAKDGAAAPKRRFVFAYTNDDVDHPTATSCGAQGRGELEGEDHGHAVKKVRRGDHAAGDRIQFTGNAYTRKAMRDEGLVNGNVGIGPARLRARASPWRSTARRRMRR